jgi:capsular exopolysaccharide synthesis family protein
MHEEVRRISDRAQNDYLYAKSSEDAIRKQFAQQEAAANVLADKTVKLQLLAQEAYSNQALYESLFSKLQTATLASGVRSTRIDVLDVARTAGHAAFPPWSKGLPVLVVISMFLGISSAFILESLDQTLRSSHDLDEIADLPVLPYIPSLRRKGRKAALRLGKDNFLETPQSAFSEAFRSLRTSIVLTTARMDKKLFLVTSPNPADGKTTVTYNLGIAFAQQGARVLLIDGDLSRPKLHLLFGRRSSPGLVDVGDLASGKGIEGIIQHPEVPALFMLPAGRRIESQSEFFASSIFEMVLDECGRNYDYVFIDSPPILSMADASIIATKVSGTIAVVRSCSTTRPIFMSLLDALDRTGSPVIGITLNDVRKPHLNGFYEYSHKGYQLHGET